jgi:predicted anti-sigma-YlaC factor YlaD
MTSMDCRRAEELLSDHLEGALHAILRAELEGHLARCADCRALRQALADVVVALHAAPELEAPSGLAGRAAAAALAQTRERVVRPAIVLPSWVQAAAAGFALVALGTALMVVGPEKPTRAAQRLVGQTVTAGSHLMERRDRIVEDVRILGVVLGTAFEGRLDRVNERVEDYRRLLDRRRATPGGDSKRGSGSRGLPLRFAEGFRTEPGAST